MSSTDPAESQLPVEPQLSVDPQQSSAQTADDPSTPSTPSDSATVNGNSADSAASGSVDSGVASSDNNDSDTKTAPVPLYDADGNPVPFQEQVKYVYVERRPDLSKRATGPAWQIMGIVAETLFTMALVCVLYIVWLMGWTGVVAQHKQDEQMQSAAWSDPSKGKNKRLASKQDGEPPVQPINPKVGDLIGAVYIPRFGNQWMRTVVEGTDKPQLNEHGIGHYPQTQMPGQIGNFAAAGHRNGYGQPLGDIDKLKEGDPIVIRTKDYWYVYEYTDHTVVTPDQVGVVAPNPRSPMLAPTQRMITLTTCEPKYSKPTHRWVAFGKLTYWAKVADGIPEELARTNQNGEIEFYNNSKRMETKLPVDSLVPFITSCLTVYAVIYLAAAVVWRWPRRREIRQHLVRKPDISIYGGLSRLQPGPTLIRVLLVLILMVAGGAALFEWVFPWAAETLPLLEQMTNVAF